MIRLTQLDMALFNKSAGTALVKLVDIDSVCIL